MSCSKHESEGHNSTEQNDFYKLTIQFINQTSYQIQKPKPTASIISQNRAKSEPNDKTYENPRQKGETQIPVG